MGTIQDALRVLGDAEASLRGMIEAGLRERRYADIAAIAPLADAIADLVRGSPSDSHPFGAPPPRSTPPPPPSPRRSSDRNYPRFLRDGDKLVKIGWSKKSRSEYEHRSPIQVAMVLLAAIRAKVRDGEMFAAADIIPLRSGEESVPDYQAYLALKWLHTEGIVTKHPRDRYAVEPGRLGPKGLEEFWLRLPTVKGSKSGGSK